MDQLFASEIKVPPVVAHQLVQQSLTSCWIRNGLTDCSFLNQFWKLISPRWEHVCSCRSSVPVQQCPPPSQHPLILANCESQVWRKHKSYLWFMLWPTRRVSKTTSISNAMQYVYVQVLLNMSHVIRDFSDNTLSNTRRHKYQYKQFFVRAVEHGVVGFANTCVESEDCRCCGHFCWTPLGQVFERCRHGWMWIVEIIDLVNLYKIIFMSHPSISSWGEASEGYTVSGLNKIITFFWKLHHHTSCKLG